MIQMIYQLDRPCRQLGFPSRYPLFQSARDRHIVGGLAGADAALVLPEGPVQDPGERISAVLAAVHELQQGPRLRRPAGDVVMGLRGNRIPCLRCDPDLPFRSAEQPEARPAAARGVGKGTLWVGRGVVSPATSPLPSPLVVLHGLGMCIPGCC